MITFNLNKFKKPQKSFCLVLSVAMTASLCGLMLTGCLSDNMSQKKAVSPKKQVSRQDFQSAVRSMRRGERWGRYQQSVKKMKEYLKTHQLSGYQRLLLLEYITVASSKLDEKNYAEALAAFRKLPESRQKKRVLSYDLIKMIMSLNFRAAEKLYRKESAGIDAYSRLTLLQEFAKSALWTLDDKKTFDLYFAKVKSLANPDAGNKGKAARFESRRKAALAKLIGELSNYDPAAADQLLAANLSLFNNSTLCSIRSAFARSAVAFEDRPRFDAELAELKKLPLSQGKVTAFLEIANSLWRIDRDLGEKLLRDEIKNDKPSFEQRFALLSGIMRLRRISGFNYGFSSDYSYQKFRSLVKEMEAAIDHGKLKKNNTIASFYNTVAVTAFDYGDYKNGAKAIAEAYDIWPSNLGIAFLAAESAMRLKERARAKTILEAIIANKRTRPDDRRVAEALLFLNSGGSVKDVEKAWADSSLAPAKKMVLLRKVSTKLYRLGRYDEVRILDAMVNKMFVPLIKKKYTCKYIPDCPKNADSWAHSQYYNDWDGMETRFAPYGDGYGINNATDIKYHLKGAKRPKTDPDYRTGVQIIYDDQGVHIFVRCNDPEIKKVVLGEKSGGSLEFLLKPGENSAYHSWYFNLPGTEDPHVVNWETPSKYYRLTYDYFKKDSAVTPDGVVAHTFIPWIMFYDRLPGDSNQWLFGMERFGRCRLSLSGLVHEMGRTVRLNFNFSKQQLTNLKKNICLAIFNKYEKIRKAKRGTVLIWQDDVLGDPEFFKTELEPLLHQLDEEGGKLKDSANDADINAIFAKFVPLWAEINYVVADKRKQYLKNKLINRVGILKKRK